ncbi:hypothetical protein E2C01_078971 [Portunus trituberculatus]|uniref:Uncharacterized protein n=1 Tax=Portunus trituberculatus TaxID=210409 RepID=A0A5B7IFR8_PORTR|nr:hypothetical protein [Portunus trituberculatus]
MLSLSRLGRLRARLSIQWRADTCYYAISFRFGAKNVLVRSRPLRVDASRRKERGECGFVVVVEGRVEEVEIEKEEEEKEEEKEDEEDAEGLVEELKV